MSDCARFGIIGIIRSCAPRRFADDAFGSSPDDARLNDATPSSKRDKIRRNGEENLKFVRPTVDILSKENNDANEALRLPIFPFFPMLNETRKLRRVFRRLRPTRLTSEKNANKSDFRDFNEIDESDKFDGATGDDV